jgi:dihydropteroate synthase
VRLGRGVFEPSQLLVMAVVPAGDPAAAMERVHEAVAEGADIVEVPVVASDSREGIGRAVRLIAAVHDAYPELVVGVRTGRPEVAREACAAGAGLLCGSGSWLAEMAASLGVGVVCPAGLAARAVEAGAEPERVVVRLESTGQLSDLVAAGWPVLVSLSGQDLAGSLATAAVGAWLGARVFRVSRVGQVLAARRVLRMVAAIRGDIPPACAVRGLALPVFQSTAGC